jgi:hypothetical protein
MRGRSTRTRRATFLLPPPPLPCLLTSFAPSVSVNGSFAAPNGVAFSGIDACFLSPALSGDGRYQVNFGDRPFAHPLPSADFMSVHDFRRAEGDA